MIFFQHLRAKELYMLLIEGIRDYYGQPWLRKHISRFEEDMIFQEAILGQILGFLPGGSQSRSSYGRRIFINIWYWFVADSDIAVLILRRIKYGDVFTALSSTEMF